MSSTDPPSDAGSYTCERCGGTFQKDPSDWTEGDAEAEAQQNWGKGGADPEMAIVCDDCHRAFMAWLAHEGLS